MKRCNYKQPARSVATKHCFDRCLSTHYFNDHCKTAYFLIMFFLKFHFTDSVMLTVPARG